MTDDLDPRLRAELRAWADEAPPASALTARIVHGAGQTPPRTRPAWLLPAIAACIVFLVVGGTVGGIALVRHHSAHPQTPVTTVGTTPPAPSPIPSAPNSPSASPTSTPTTAPPPSTPVPAVGPVGGPVPAGFVAHDLTFVSTTEGWALGTAPCATAPCTSLVRTVDGGRTWVGIRPPVVGLSGVDSCVSVACVDHVRFATPLVGYLFGLSVTYLTTDGGTTWTRLSGGTFTLEIANGTALRATSPGGTACLPGCPVTVLRSTVGSTVWTPVLNLSSGQVGTDTGVQLARTGHAAYLAVYGHTSGGAQAAHTGLWVSLDDGLTWTARGEPCPQAGTAVEIDATALTTADDGSVTVLCTVRSGGNSAVAVSVDGGRTFHAGKALDRIEIAVGSASSSVPLLVGSVNGQEALVRSTDGGANWLVVAQAGTAPTGGTQQPGFLGFESATTGRWVAAAYPHTVWTTTDAGATWTPYTFR